MIYIYIGLEVWMSSPSQICVIDHTRAYYFFVSFSSFIRDERFEKTMRFDSTKKVSSFVKKKRKTQSINCLELTASVPTEHFLKDKISRGVSEPSKAWFGRFLDETTMQRLQRNIIEYIDWKKEKKKKSPRCSISRFIYLEMLGRKSYPRITIYVYQLGLLKILVI